MRYILTLLTAFAALAATAQTKVVLKASGSTVTGGGLSQASRDSIDGAITAINTNLTTNYVVKDGDKTLCPPSDASLLQSVASRQVFDSAKYQKTLDITGVQSVDWRTYRVRAMRALGSPIVAETFGTQVASNTSTTYNMTDADVRLHYIYIDEADTITGAKFILRTAGVYNADAAAYNGVALYKVTNVAAGTLTRVAYSASDTALWKASSTSVPTAAPFTSPYIAEPGAYYIGLVYNATSTTTAPAVHGGGSASGTYHHALDFAGSLKIAASAGASGSTPPSSITMSAASTIGDRVAAYLYK